MNNLEQGDACLCITFEERLDAIEKLMQTSTVMPPIIVKDRHSVHDFNYYPVLIWDENGFRLRTERGIDENVNILTPNEFLEKAGCIHKPQGTSQIRHHFI